MRVLKGTVFSSYNIDNFYMKLFNTMYSQGHLIRTHLAKEVRNESHQPLWMAGRRITSRIDSTLRGEIRRKITKLTNI